MDLRLQQAARGGDVTAFLHLVQENKEIIYQTTFPSMNTVLHIAASFNHVALVSEIIKLGPDLVLAENTDLETPVFKACRGGHADVVKALLDVDPSAADKLNRRQESVLLVACSLGRNHVVKHLLVRHEQLIKFEEDIFSTTSLHFAASEGNTDIVRKLVHVGPKLAWKRDAHGCYPLHSACTKGFLEIARELIMLDADLCLLQDIEGKTPLHCAAMRGQVNILNEIMSTKPESAEIVTNNNETVLHLAAKNRHLKAIKYLVKKINNANLVNSPDNEGNTILHLAAAADEGKMVKYLVTTRGINVNALNHKGLTPFDLVDTKRLLADPLVESSLKDAGGIRRSALSSETQNNELQYSPVSSLSLSLSLSETQNNDELQHSPVRPLSGIQNNELQYSPQRSSQKASRTNSLHRRKQDYHRHRAKQNQLQTEGLQNVRNTITVVAVLIAAVAFAAGINPPGGMYQDGVLMGKAVLGRTTPYKVFMVCNNVALFLSLGIVIIQVSVIPFERKPMMTMLSLIHKIMWVSLSFMAAAYIAATWAISNDHGKSGKPWMLVVIVAIGGGSFLSLFVGLGVFFVKHTLRKSKWRTSRVIREVKKYTFSRRKTKSKNGSDTPRPSRHSSSTNSDVDSESDIGLHPI